MYKCHFCGFSSDSLDDFDEDFKNHKGFWCPDCDGFNQFDNKRAFKPGYRLFLETPFAINNSLHCISAPFKTNVSLLRYPGGKSRLTGLIYENCRSDHMENFIEPFAGGASVGISLLLADKVHELWLNDADFGIYSLYHMIKYMPDLLKSKIRTFTPSQKAFDKSKTNLLHDYTTSDMYEAAWNALIVNRMAFSGIPYANSMSIPSARWNPKTLCKRIDEIHAKSDHIHVFGMDACDFIQEYYWLPDATLFIDPPYYEKGSSLYHCYYTEDQHVELAFLLDELYKSFPYNDMIITYDNSPAIQDIYQYPEKYYVTRKYSIAN